MTEPETTWPILTRFNQREMDAIDVLIEQQFPGLSRPEAVRAMVKEYMEGVGALGIERADA